MGGVGWEWGWGVRGGVEAAHGGGGAVTCAEGRGRKLPEEQSESQPSGCAAGRKLTRTEGLKVGRTPPRHSRLQRPGPGSGLPAAGLGDSCQGRRTPRKSESRSLGLSGRAPLAGFYGGWGLSLFLRGRLGKCHVSSS